MTTSGTSQLLTGRSAVSRLMRRQLIGWRALLATSLLGINLCASASESAPLALDPMHGDEKTRAMQTLSEPASAQDSAPRTRRFTSAATGVPVTPVLLLMERRRIKGSSERLADAWYYSYPSNETTHRVIDLTTGAIRSSEIVIDLQLPLVEAEIGRAFDIVLSSAGDRSALQNAYRQVTGSEFLDRSQVSYKAFVIHPDTVQDGLVPDARRCGIHRCAQMLLYTHDNVALDMSPVVDLSTGQVLQNLELRAQSIVRSEEVAR